MKSVLVPIFDTELKNNHTFLLGQITIKIEEKKDKLFFII